MSKSIGIGEGRAILKAVKKTALKWKNPATGNLVCYQRARNLKFFNKKNVEFGIEGKAGKFISLARALSSKILKPNQLKHAA
jgi:hypothetical protein